MTIQLDKSALFEAMEAFWSASEVGNDKGVEAAIAAYLARIDHERLHERRQLSGPHGLTAAFFSS